MGSTPSVQPRATTEEATTTTTTMDQPVSPKTTMLSNTTAKKPFFGVPVVGFFQQRKRGGTTPSSSQKKRSRPAATEEQQPMLTADGNRTELAHYTEEPCATIPQNVTFETHGLEVSEGDSASSNIKKRTGKELWSILRDHVQHESFHIRTVWRSMSNKSIRKDVLFNEVSDIPYDFTLKDCLVALLVYLAISVIAFSFVFERWSVIDSMYFAVVTFTTIGYGDITPSTPAGRLFCVLFAFGGVAVLAIALGVVGSKIIESEVQHIAKAEEEIVKDVFRVFQPQKAKDDKQGAFLQHGKSPSGSFGYLADADDPLYSLREEMAQAVHPCHVNLQRCRMFCKVLARYLPSLTPLLLGASLIGHYEGWTWDDIVYYCVVTTTTIGFGDFTPNSEAMKLFAVFFIPLSVGAMGHFLGTIAAFIVEQRTQIYDKRLWRHELTLEDLITMSHDNSGTVTELDFVVFMLQAMKKVDEDLIDKIRAHFQKMDLTQSGTLVRGDLELMARKKLRSARSKLRLGRYKASLSRQGSLCKLVDFLEQHGSENDV